MNPFSKKNNPKGDVNILKKYLTNDKNNNKNIFNFELKLKLSDIIIGREVIINTSRSDISSITEPSRYNTPRLDDE